MRVKRAAASVGRLPCDSRRTASLRADMPKKFPVNPKHPERNCWGCDHYCSAKSMMCGNGSERTQHPVELFGEDWIEWSNEAPAAESGVQAASPIGGGAA
jgi:hypothetical protein